MQSDNARGALLMVAGMFLFREWPDPVTFAGAALIVGTGLFTFYRERQLRAATAHAQRLR